MFFLNDATHCERNEAAGHVESHSMRSDSLRCGFLLVLLYLIFIGIGNPLFAEWFW